MQYLRGTAKWWECLGRSPTDTNSISTTLVPQREIAVSDNGSSIYPIELQYVIYL